MDDFTKALKHDLLVEQFKDKPNIAALAEAIGGELQEIFDFFEQLRNERNLDRAVGKQLDGVGDIVVMTRMAAGQLAGNPIPIKVIDDDHYRKYLIYKVLKNTCNCTYSDIIKAFKMFWDRPIYYSEYQDKPATMFLRTEPLKWEDDISALTGAPIIKAAGVGIELQIVLRLKPFVNEPERFLLHRYIVSMAFSHIRRPWVRFDGEVSFDGSILFDQTPAGIRLPRFGVRVRFVELCRRAVRFDGEAGFDGTIQFDQTISSTGISTFGILARLSHKTALSGPDVRLSALRIPEKPGRAGIPRMTVTASLPRHKVQTGGSVTMDNWRGMDGSITFDSTHKFDAYLLKEEL